MPAVSLPRTASWRRVHAEVDGAVDAQVDWAGVGLTFFRDFPNLALRLDGLTVVGLDPFAGDTLLSMERFRFVLDAGCLIPGWKGTGPFLVRSVQLGGPAVRLMVLPDGTSNWDIARARDDSPGPVEHPSRGMGVELRDLGITNGGLRLENAQTGLYASLEGLRLELAGDFSRERFVVRTRIRADRTTVRFAGMPYLEGAALDFVADLEADLANRASRSRTTSSASTSCCFGSRGARHASTTSWPST